MVQCGNVLPVHKRIYIYTKVYILNIKRILYEVGDNSYMSLTIRVFGRLRHIYAHNRDKRG